MTFYTYNESEKKQIEQSEIDDSKLVVGFLTAKELEKSYQSFGFSCQTVESCQHKADSFRSAIEIHESYTFTDLKIMNAENVREAQDYVAIYVKKNLIIMVDVEDRDNSTINKFTDAIDRYARQNISVEKIIYAFMMNLIANDNTALENLSTSINELEKSVVENRTSKTFNNDLFSFKTTLTKLHSYYEQLLDIAQEFCENENNIFDGKYIHYISNVSNKIVRLDEDVVEMLNNLNHLQDVYSTNIDLQMNKTMKIFTAVATIFLPLTLITGWFGMNFTNMPSINSKIGYPCVIVAVILIVIGLSIFGKIKNWWVK